MAIRVNKQQRVGVFVDVQNMYYSAKNLYKAKVNFKSILQEAVKGRNLIRAIAYVVEAQELKEKSFFDALENIGFETKFSYHLKQECDRFRKLSKKEVELFFN